MSEKEDAEELRLVGELLAQGGVVIIGGLELPQDSAAIGPKELIELLEQSDGVIVLAIDPSVRLAATIKEETHFSPLPVLAVPVPDSCVDSEVNCSGPLPEKEKP